MYPVSWLKHEKNLMRAVHAGAIWTDVTRYKSCQAASPKCYHCQHHTGDLHHLLWVCPAFASFRESVWSLLGSQDPSMIPRELALHGFCPRQSAASSGPLWCGGEDPYTFDAACCALFGGHPSAQWASLDMLAFLLKGRASYDMALDVAPVPAHGLSNLPAVFANGCSRAMLAGMEVGGAGVILAATHAVERTTAGSLFEDCVFGGHLGERSRRAPLRGPCISTDRADCLALLLAALVPGPLSITVSSDAVYMAAQQALHRVATTNTPATSAHVVPVSFAWYNPFWSLKSDGDLYAVFEAVVRAKGPRAFAVARLPRASSERDSREGRIATADWHGLDLARKAAAQAAREVASPCQAVAPVLHERRRTLVRLVHAIQSSMVGILKHDSHLRGRPAPMQHSTRVTILAAIPCPQQPLQEVELRRFSAPFMEQSSAPSNWQAALRNFLLETRWAKAQSQGAPLLLLLVLFERISGFKVYPQNKLVDRALAIQPSLRETLHAFRKSLATLINDILHPDTRSQFRIAAKGMHALNALAITGYTPVLAVWPIAPPELWKQCATDVLRMRSSLPIGWHQRLLEGSLSLTRQQLNLGGIPPWRRSAVGPSQGQSVESSPARPVYGIRCLTPSCLCVIPLKGKPSREVTSWPKVRCPPL